MDPLYRRDGGALVPSELTRGPWDAAAQHGGAPAALIAGALETFEGADRMALARLTFEFLRPVPLTPLTLSVGLDRPGRRVERLTAVLSAGDKEIVRTSGLRIRRGGEQLVAPQREPPPPMPPPREDDDAAPGDNALVGFARDAMEIRFVQGNYNVPGPATAWFRLRAPVVDDEPASALQRAIAAADFGNGVSSVLDWERSLFINADLTVYFERDPAGEWTCLKSVTELGPAGVAVAESVLYDSGGRIGRAAQALVVEGRAAPQTLKASGTSAQSDT